MILCGTWIAVKVEMQLSYCYKISMVRKYVKRKDREEYSCSYCQVIKRVFREKRGTTGIYIVL